MMDGKHGTEDGNDRRGQRNINRTEDEEELGDRIPFIE